MISYDILAYRLFGKLARRFENDLPKLDPSLKKAGLNFTSDEWLSMVFFNAIISSVVISILAVLISLFIVSSIISSIPIAIGTGILIGLGVGVFTFYYPSQLIGNRNKKIDNSLHFATIYMATLAGTGMPPYKIFAILSKFKEFTEISKTAEEINKYIEVFGLDFNEALEQGANNTPNKDLHDLLWSLRSTIQAGGNIRKFLDQRAVALTNQYRRRLENYVKTLSLFLEMYITVVIVGSVFVLVLTTIMGILGGNAEQIQLLQVILITIGLPAMSLVFIVILKTINPTEV